MSTRSPGRPAGRSLFTGFLVLCALCLDGSLLSGRATAQSVDQELDAEPYDVYVAEAQSHARCGPGGDFYRTESLKHGQSLEVYLETEDGWLGVRPPESSFSWILADDVELDRQGETGKVVEDGAVVWIGTHLGRARRYRWQVQLAADETVTILGNSQREGPDGPQTWYRIVPPSGEFRWVHRDQVVESSAELIASIKAAGNSVQTRDSGTPRLDRRVAAQEPGATGESSPTRQSASSRRRQTTAESVAQVAPRAPTQATTAEAPVPDLIPKASAATPMHVAAQSPTLTPVPDPTPTTSPTADPTPTGDRRDHYQGGQSLATITSEPRLLDSRIAESQRAPAANEVAMDSNWVLGDRQPTLAKDGPSNVRQTSGLQPMKTHDLTAAIATAGGWPSNADAQSNVGTPPAARPRAIGVTDPSSIDQITSEVQDADLSKLQLVFSRLVADAAPAVAVDPIEAAARDMIGRSSNDLEVSRARMLIERVQRYRRIAGRRDVPSVSSIPAAGSVRIAAASIPVDPPIVPSTPTDTASGTTPMTQDGWVRGTLVQVYSARDRHPPFALTDNLGTTIAYVTPFPGVNLRRHLNSEIRIQGNHGFISGMKTPHVVASKVVRVTE